MHNTNNTSTHQHAHTHMSQLSFCVCETPVHAYNCVHSRNPFAELAKYKDPPLTGKEPTCALCGSIKYVSGYVAFEGNRMVSINKCTRCVMKQETEARASTCK